MSAQKLVGEQALSALASDIKSTVALKANSADVYPKTDTYTKQETDDEIIEALTNALPKATVSGSIATFSTSLELPLVECKAEIVATQAGTGTPTPSNPRSISGVSSVGLTHTGKNLFDPSVYSSFLQLDGKYRGAANSIVAVRTNVGGYIGKQLTFSVYADLTVSPTPTNAKVAVNINGVTTTGNPIESGNAGYSSVTFTPQSENDFILITFGSAGGNSFTFYDIQLEASSTRTAYYPYSAETKTITLGQTIYGGNVDAKNGKLVVMYGVVDLGDLNWSNGSTNQSGVFRKTATISNALILSEPTTVPDIKCEIYGKTSPLQTYRCNEGVSLNNTAHQITIYDSNYNTDSSAELTAFKQAVSGKKFVYPLATPIEITGLTPANFTTINGEQNIFSDCGDISVTYCHEADATDYTELSNKPTINGVTLTGNKTTADLGLWLDLSGTLTAGTTEITFISEAITANSFIQVFTPDGTDYTSISVSTGEIVLTFDAQEADLPIKVRIS